MTTEQESAWQTESGLIDDVDGWFANCHFGFKEEYKSKVQETAPGEESGAMFLADIHDAAGEVIGNQGWSIGTGWTISPDGYTISHIKRSNVVHSSLYGQLQNKVVGDLDVNMDQYGKPTDARAWDGLGFHLNLIEHDTVGGAKKQGLMPTAFLGKKAGIAPQPAAATGTATAPAPAAQVPTEVPDAVEMQLIGLVTASADAKSFQLSAVKRPAVATNDALMARVLDDGPSGFYAQYKK